MIIPEYFLLQKPLLLNMWFSFSRNLNGNFPSSSKRTSCFADSLPVTEWKENIHDSPTIIPRTAKTQTASAFGKRRCINADAATIPVTMPE